MRRELRLLMEKKAKRREYNRKHNARRAAMAVNSYPRGIVVIQPGQAFPDHWTKVEYARYKHELPEGTRVWIDGVENL